MSKLKNNDFPFHFGTVASGDFFYDRSDDAVKLHDLVAGGQNVVLYAPRRYGKSSLALKVAESWKKDGFICIYFDLMRVESMDEFIRSYANAAIAAEGRTEHGRLGPDGIGGNMVCWMWWDFHSGRSALLRGRGRQDVDSRRLRIAPSGGALALT